MMIHLHNLAFARSERLQNVAQIFLWKIDIKIFERLKQLAVFVPMKNDLGSRDHHFVALAPHLLNQDGDLHLATSMNFKCPRRFRVVDLKRNVPPGFPNEPIANMSRRHKFPLASGKRRIVHQDAHSNRWRIDIDKLKRRALFSIGQRFTDISVFKSGKAHNFAGARFLGFDLFETGMGKERGDGSAFAISIAMKTDNRIANTHAAANDATESNAPDIITVIKIRNEHLKKGIGRNLRWRHVLNNGLEKRSHVFVLIVQFAHGKTIPGAGVNDRKVELLIARFQFDEEIEDQVQRFARFRVLSVDLVNDDDGFETILQRLAQNETSLRLRSIVRVDHEQNAIDHLHNSFDLTAKVGVTRGVDNVDAVTVPLKRRVLRANSDPLLALEIHRVHHPLLDFLIRPKSPRLTQELIHECGLAVIDVRNDGDVTDIFHGACSGARRSRRIWPLWLAASTRNMGFPASPLSPTGR